MNPLSIIRSGVLLLTLIIFSASAREAPPPIEAFFRPPAMTHAVLSPDGRKLAVVTTLNDKRNVAIVDLDTRKADVLTSYTIGHVADLYWAGSRRVVFTVGMEVDPYGPMRYLGTRAADIDGGNIWEMSAGAYGRVLRNDLADGEIIIDNGSMVERLNTRNRKRVDLVEDPPRLCSQWLIDVEHAPRACAALLGTTQQIWTRKADGPWRKVREIEKTTDHLGLLAFDSRAQSLIVAAREGEDLRHVRRLDPETGKAGDVLYKDALADWNGSVVFDRGQPVGLRMQSGRPVTLWWDESLGALQAQIDAALPGRHNVFAPPSGTSGRTIVRSGSDKDPGQFFLFDAAARTLDPIGVIRPWIEPKQMGERRFLTYAARDGLNIPAYLTLPARAKAEKLPLVIHVHGGPWLRAYFWQDWSMPVAQFLASRGYAVLEPEPRGSDGFGRRHLEAGFGQWGLAMQDDITDGARQLIKDGIVDPERICIMGASYGGYATLQGLVREPALFKCGIAVMAVSDLSLMESIRWSSLSKRFLDGDFKKWVGDPDVDAKRFRATSPALNADRIRAPVLLVHGSNDYRVPMMHGEKMRNALREQGKPVEWVLYNDEGHGWSRQETILDYYARIEGFLARHIGAPQTPSH